MSLITYAGVVTAVQSRCGTSEAAMPTADITDMLWEVESKIWATLRVREMRDAYTFTYATGGVAFTTIDTNMLEIIALDVTISSDDIRTPSPASEFRVRQILQENDPTGPLVFGWVTQSDGTIKLVIAPEPIAASVTVTFYKKFATLSSATNVVFLAYPHVWLNGLTAEAFMFQQDFDMYSVWDKKFSSTVAVATKMNDGGTEALKGNTTKPSLGYAVP